MTQTLHAALDAPWSIGMSISIDPWFMFIVLG